MRAHQIVRYIRWPARDAVDRIIDQTLTVKSNVRTGPKMTVDTYISLYQLIIKIPFISRMMNEM